MAPSPLHGRPQPQILVTTAGAGAVALAALPAILLGTAAVTTGGVLTGLNLGSKIPTVPSVSYFLLICCDIF